MFSLVESDEGVDIDNYKTQQLDVDDMKMFEGKTARNPASIIGHFLAEQKEMQKLIGGKSYTEAHHQDGLPAETKITGFTLQPGKDVANITVASGNKVNGTWELTFTRGTEVRKIISTIKNSNTIKVEERIIKK